MTKVLKWILYILLGLAALAIIAGIAFMIFSGYGGYTMLRPGIRMMEPMRFYFNPVRSIFGWLLGLGVCLLVVVGIVALVNALVRTNQPAQMTTPAQPVIPARTCSNCGKPAQEDWKTCPYCGNTLA